MRSASAALLLCLLIILWSRLAAAETWYVPSPDPSGPLTIQAAIELATSSDTIIVGPGQFDENVRIIAKSLIVMSEIGPLYTIIHGDGTTSTVTIDAGVDGSAIVSGFTIRGGGGTGSIGSRNGGGVFIRDSEPLIVGNLITANTADSFGGGIYCTATTGSWSPIIRNNTFANNRAGWQGGAIAVRSQLDVEIVDNVFSNNTVEFGDGGAISLMLTNGGSRVVNNNMLGNCAGDHGGGLYVSRLGAGSLSLEIGWNVLQGNHASGGSSTGNSGGGIWLWETDAWVHHNTIVQNTGDGPTNAYGGGIVIDGAGTPLLEKNVIAFNLRGGGIWCGGEATPEIKNNLAWQNDGGDGVNDCPAWWQSDGNVVDNPYFCDLGGGDLTVASNSGVMTHPAGPLGAFPIPGCGPVASKPITWGQLKSRFR